LKKQLLLAAFLLPMVSFCQIGGNYVYEFLSIPLSPRSSALGGSAIAINDGDITLAYENPALLTPTTSGKFAIQYVNYLSDVNYGLVSYAKDISKVGTFGIGLQYVNGGEFINADADGNTFGTFGTSELALNLAYNKTINRLV